MGYRDSFYKNYYRTQGSQYDSASLPEKIAASQKNYKHEVVTFIPAKDSKILELGCGYGPLLLLLRDLGYSNASGIDVSPEQVSLAKEQGLDNVQLGSAEEHLSNSNEKYDVIIGVDLIEHFTKDELVSLLELIKNSLNPNGVVLFRTPNCDGLFGSTYAYGDFTHEIYLNYQSAQQLMLSAGFSEVEVNASHIEVAGFFKNLIRKLLWLEVVVASRLILFASGKSSRNVLYTPNLVIKAVSA